MSEPAAAEPAAPAYAQRALGLVRAWLARLLVLGLTALIFFLAPQMLRPPVPQGAWTLTQAEFRLGDRPPEVVNLPHKWPQDAPAGPAQATYRFALPPVESDAPHVLLIPVARHRLTAQINGRMLQADTPRPTGSAAGLATIMDAPIEEMRRGSVVEIALERDGGMVPGYLSPVHIVQEDALGGARWRWTLGDGVLRMVAMAIHGLIVFAVAIVWIARPREPVFGWLFLSGAASLLNVVIGSSSMIPDWLEPLQPYVMLMVSGLGLTVIGMVLAIMDRPRPMWLKAGVVILPVFFIILGATRILPLPVCFLASAVVALGANLAAAAILLAGAGRSLEWDELFLAIPVLLTGAFGFRDLGIMLGLVNAGQLMTTYIRSLTIIAVLALLMRRFVASLRELDAANATQRRKLLEQEVELRRLHQEEHRRMAQAAREEERQRLMRDLHDGLSGHLVSIIALSEREARDPAAIEKAARAALEDLRLVVNSLDLEDGDLRLALAGFHERLGPQLRRLGVDLDWSMEDLPEVSGVTPANALSILRILQEAVTNALKHGPARRLAVRGAGIGGCAVLTVWNDREDAAHAPGKGNGLNNMRRRARSVGGDIHFDCAADHAVLTLNLPLRLTEG